MKKITELSPGDMFITENEPNLVFILVGKRENTYNSKEIGSIVDNEFIPAIDDTGLDSFNDQVNVTQVKLVVQPIVD